MPLVHTGMRLLLLVFVTDIYGPKRANRRLDTTSVAPVTTSFLLLLVRHLLLLAWHLLLLPCLEYLTHFHTTSSTMFGCKVRQMRESDIQHVLQQVQAHD